MPVLNHHIVATRDKEATARYFSEMLGLEEALKLGEFAVLKVSGDVTLDFRDSDDDFDRLHYAFLVTEAEFDEIFGRIRERGIDLWSDPMHDDVGHTNNRDDGLGVYASFDGSRFKNSRLRINAADMRLAIIVSRRPFGRRPCLPNDLGQHGIRWPVVHRDSCLHIRRESGR